MTAPYHQDESVTLHHGDCLGVMRELPDSSVDSVVTDPPYGLGFMGREWDALPPGKEWAAECLRVLKPGGHLLAFGGSRTWHRLQCAVEDAGFEIRDSIAWLYGSGFPKSLDVSKAIDKRPGVARHPEFARHLAERREAKGLTRQEVALAVVGTATGACWNWEHHQFPEAKWWPALRDLLQLDDTAWGPVIAEAERSRIGTRTTGRGTGRGAVAYIADGDNDAITAPATDAAKQWQGWGTALKPAFEPIVVGRKPLAAAGVNVLAAVESSLRERGIQEIKWTSGFASGAAKPAPAISSSSTVQQPVGATSAGPVDEYETPNAERPTGNGSATSTPPGAKRTASTSATTPDRRPGTSATKSSTLTAGPAPVVTNERVSFSPSTTSAAAAPPTVKRHGARSTTRSSGSDSLTVTESFAGTATGLTGSWATVRIDRLSDGTFVWPDGLPRTTTGGSTVAANVLQHGTGALNIDACRVTPLTPEEVARSGRSTNGAAVYGEFASVDWKRSSKEHPGRWPTNVVMDETQAAELDRQTGILTSGGRSWADGDSDTSAWRQMEGRDDIGRRSAYQRAGDSGGASRFFPTFRYEAKAPTSERPTGEDGTAHPTVKPLDLMRWLVRLVTPPGGTVLEPFAGSGTTVEACIHEGFRCVAIEREAAYLPLILQRITKPMQTGLDFGEVSA